ncbi:type II toxin-antitoxin system Phd/YefM family antitoxin [Candidatus Peregrinibacteria bacterium]|jgi:antitoxin YefM|nr:type II toxin-antitoxin system Phd/YefM family antitoxin [Candidatus Peregrinibacteria bacterium]MBT7484031.1 type II toxin-antitoxin system Phd/YefM family antitoxin [Candidatus Peregrinibacteria bacterium]MBT7703136.1 type II toxin-antitoxin system Phd/YefM family antitoxin [Candidatus Peregrinibacteria bacterium]
MKKFLSATEARKQLFQLIKALEQPDSEVVITVDSKPKIVMISYDEYEGLLETLDILSDPKAMKGIEEGEADIKAGRVVPWEDVKKELNL